MGFFSFKNFLRFTFYLGRYPFFFFLLTFQFLLIWSFFVIFYCFFSFWIKFSFKSLTYSSIVLSFFCIVIWKFETWKSFSGCTSVSTFCCFFSINSIYGKNSIKKFTMENFFLPSENSITMLLSSINFIPKSKMSPASFVMKLFAKCCVCQLTSCDWKLALTHLEIFKNFFRPLISFSLITPIAW